MDNLITAVIAAGILAAIALMSANYSGEAISNWQTKSDASKIVADAKIIADAWREYARANNGDPTFTNGNFYWGGATNDLVPNYLSRVPTPPKGSVPSTAPYYYPITMRNYGLSISCGSIVMSSKKPTDTIAAQLKSPLTCTAIAKMGGFSAATVKASSLVGDLSAVSSRRPYDCIYVDSDSSGAPSQGDSMLFVYRVFDQNNFTIANNLTCPP